jgi:hypothetical protein
MPSLSDWIMRLGLSLSICQPQPTGEPGWSPRDIANVDGYIDPRFGVTTGADDRVQIIVEQVHGLPMQMSYTNPDGVGGHAVGEANAWRPQFNATGFGALPSLHMDPVDAHPRSTHLRLAATRPLVGGLSWLWISKHTSDKTVRGHTQNCPLTVISESSVDTFSGAGFNAGELAYHSFHGGMWQEANFGADYNDGVARLYCITHATNDEVKAYVNGVQVGDTESATYFTEWMAWSAIGTGYRAEPPVDPYGGDDGFVGELGPVIVVDGIITPEDHAALYLWARSQGWVP